MMWRRRSKVEEFGKMISWKNTKILKKALFPYNL